MEALRLLTRQRLAEVAPRQKVVSARVARTDNAMLRRPLLNITIRTPKGKAGIISRQEWDQIGPYAVVGQGAVVAKTWIEKIVGNQSAPCDLYRAALLLEVQAQVGFILISVEARQATVATP
jgi:hypothetical protein